MHPYQRLVVCQRAHALAASLYRQGALDESPRYRALVDQTRRSAGSIAANIAEGAGSGSQLGFAKYLGIALASAYELESHFLLARDVGCVSSDRGTEYAEQIQSIKRMLTTLRARVKESNGPNRKANGGPP
jgi:four helix bundle protein